MSCVMVGGYPENDRKKILKHALGIFNKKKHIEYAGIRQIYRPKHWQVDVRRKQNTQKKYGWSAKGGCISTIFVPPTLMGNWQGS